MVSVCKPRLEWKVGCQERIHAASSPVKMLQHSTVTKTVLSGLYRPIFSCWEISYSITYVPKIMKTGWQKGVIAITKIRRVRTDGRRLVLDFWISKNFQLSRSCDLDLDRGLGHTTYCHASLTNLCIPIHQISLRSDDEKCRRYIWSTKARKQVSKFKVTWSKKLKKTRTGIKYLAWDNLDIIFIFIHHKVTHNNNK